MLGVNDDNLYINIINNTTYIPNWVITSTSLVVNMEEVDSESHSELSVGMEREESH